MGQEHQIRQRVHVEVLSCLAPVELQHRLRPVETGAGDHEVDVRMLGNESGRRTVECLEVGEVRLAGLDVGTGELVSDIAER